ncbi:MAG: ABC transporter substrate-binding protein [Gammaproteobacteria bacterium]|nr:ABC transporter substrate-binding protein [Gammaproteobacteria bacterium]
MSPWIGAAFLLSLALPALAAEAPCRRSFHYVDSPPLGNGDRDQDHAYDDAWLHAILKESGCELAVERRRISAQRMHDLLERGEVDVLAQASYLPERARYAYFSEAYRNERVWLYVRRKAKEDLLGLSLTDIAARKLTLLVPSAGWFGPEFAALRPQLARMGLLVEYRDSAQAAGQFDGGRADLILASDNFGFQFEAQMPNVLRQERPIYENPVHLMLSRQSTTPEDVARLNRAIQRLRARGYEPR